MSSIRKKSTNSTLTNPNTPKPHLPQLVASHIPITSSLQNSQPQEENQINPLQVLQHAQLLMKQDNTIESINLLKGMIDYLESREYSEMEIMCLIYADLAICYYKTGFLEESLVQFENTTKTIKQLIKNLKINNKSNLSKKTLKIKYGFFQAKVLLQICILYSEQGKHEKAMQFAKDSIKITYNVLYDLQITQCQQLNSILRKNKSAYDPIQTEIICPGYQNLINNLSILGQILQSTFDMKVQHITKDKAEFLETEMILLEKYGHFPRKSDLDKLFAITPENSDILWIYKSKILDEIQLKFFDQKIFQTKSFWKNNTLIQKITFLTISLYCYSTQTRFMQKNQTVSDPSQVLDSQHWLSRSLEIAYSFLPQEAPILNQIFTVHDRFHGIDKQTIPEDKEIGGYFKVLRPPLKPKSIYCRKNTMCSPIMIRIRVPQLKIDIKQTQNDEEEIFQPTQTISARTTRTVFRNAPSKTLDIDFEQKKNSIKVLSKNKNQNFDLAQIWESNQKGLTQKRISGAYVGKKLQTGNFFNRERMKINLTNIVTPLQYSKNLRRPNSYEKQPQIFQDFKTIQTQHKRRASSYHRQEKKQKNKAHRPGGFKLDGILGNHKKNEEDLLEIKSYQNKMPNIQKIKGNIFINNNINLYISKQSSDQQSGLKNTEVRLGSSSKRQVFLNKRKFTNTNLASTNFQFCI